MRKVIILTVAGKPEIEVERHLGREEISRIVSRRYGYQGIHLPHSWLAFEYASLNRRVRRAVLRPLEGLGPAAWTPHNI